MSQRCFAFQVILVVVISLLTNSQSLYHSPQKWETWFQWPSQFVVVQGYILIFQASTLTTKLGCSPSLEVVPQRSKECKINWVRKPDTRESLTVAPWLGPSSKKGVLFLIEQLLNLYKCFQDQNLGFSQYALIQICLNPQATGSCSFFQLSPVTTQGVQLLNSGFWIPLWGPGT